MNTAASASLLPFAVPMGALEAALGILIIADLCLLGTERQRPAIRFIALQGVVLGIMPLLAHTESVDAHLVGMAVMFLVIKAVIMPQLLLRTYRSLPPAALGQPYLGTTACVVVGLMGYAFSLWLGERVGGAANPLFSLIFPTAFATVFSGLLLIVTRKRALAQMFGYLVMENGIYLLGVPMAQVNPVWLELSILLDILGGVFVMGIAVHHIHRAFDSTDVDHFATLRD